MARNEEGWKYDVILVQRHPREIRSRTISAQGPTSQTIPCMCPSARVCFWVPGFVSECPCMFLSARLCVLVPVYLSARICVWVPGFVSECPCMCLSARVCFRVPVFVSSWRICVWVPRFVSSWRICVWVPGFVSELMYMCLSAQFCVWVPGFVSSWRVSECPGLCPVDVCLSAWVCVQLTCVWVPGFVSSWRVSKCPCLCPNGCLCLHRQTDKIKNSWKGRQKILAFISGVYSLPHKYIWTWSIITSQ